ncbi:MAG: leucine--tRNA ligase [Ilumatobacteraceae bacterium]
MSGTPTPPIAPTPAPDDDAPAHRYTSALAQEIEQRWQDRWDADGTFETPNPTGPLADPDAIAPRGAKLFILDMFPYPSGTGLHVGHPLGFTGTDVYARYQRMAGRNVLYTMGFDAFGLPAEQFAVQTGTHPAVTTADNIVNYRRQIRRLGLSHDRRRSIDTTDPGYFRWTQWIFTQTFESWFDPDATRPDGGLGRARPIAELRAELDSGARSLDDGRRWAALSASEQADVIDGERLAYVANAPVNWCPGLGTVVANEEVTADGRSDRGNFPVFQRAMRQWMMRITAYADRLIDDLDVLDWSDSLKSMQRNWIGRSPGARVDFASPAGPITVFTTRPDTLFGATFMVLAPEHPLVPDLTAGDEAVAVLEYRRQAAARKDVDRMDEGRVKTGAFTGSYATNPVTGQDVPIWIADYVLMGYGTGAIMAVPCGDQRDFEFADSFGLDVPAIQRPPDEWFAARRIEPTLDTSRWPEAFIGDAPYVNSSNGDLDLDGLSSVAEGVAATNTWLEANGYGEATITYKLRDWLFSRQRYWGEPFPIVYDVDGHAHTLPDDQLPLTLPETDSFAPRTFDPDDEFSEPESPLDRLDWWTEVELDLGDGVQLYRRDSNVMPQWAGSCWYELRYCDPTNELAFVDPEVERYWMGPRPEIRPDHPGGVDLYVGGVEHAVLHLLYARFWHKVLYDLGHLTSHEPYARLFNQGYVLAAAYTDERGMYVDADEVVAVDDGFSSAGRPVTREWGKMGKSLKNAVSPEVIYEAYGSDTLRLHLMATGPLDASRPWETRDVVGMYRFLQRLWRNIVDEHTGMVDVVDHPPDDETRRRLHRTIDVVRAEVEALRFNTAIAKLIELNNHLTKSAGPMSRQVAEALTLMLAPFAPHVGEELWHRLGHDETVTYVPFPLADPALLVEASVEYPVQVNGKVRSHIVIAADATAQDVEAAALADARVIAAVDGSVPKKVIVVPGRMVSIVV